jgi:hypothetical protein
MKEMTVEATSKSTSTRKYLVPAVILVVVALLVGGFLAYRSAQTPEVPLEAPRTITTISQDQLAAQDGLQVQLVAVTAAGGLVDVRLKIVDADKAKALLDDQANYPSLLVGDGVVLQVSPDAAEQDIQFENDKSIFVIYSNAQGVVKPGEPVVIQFGDLQVEAIQAQ